MRRRHAPDQDDVTWVFTPKPEGGCALEQAAQMLLQGDLAEVIP